MKAPHQLIKIFSFSKSIIFAVSFTNLSHFLFALSVTTQEAIKIPFLSFRYSDFSHSSV
ncbi:MAG: hypothetical protein P1U46_01945 [Patescibacteria group bacterium]|nr:hypothetical protein [Patescibacteria group bacterium]